MQSSFRQQGLYAVVFLVGVLIITAYVSNTLPLSAAENQIAFVDQIDPNTPAKQNANTEAFDIVMSVITHQRCMNCHPTDDRPRQRDEQILHLFNVQRGEDNHGGPGANL